MRQYGIARRRADGRAYRLVGATADVTEIRQGELDLQAARAETEWTREHMQALLDNMRDGVGSAMADGTYLTSNKAMFQQIDIPRDTIVALGTMQNIWRYQYEHALVPRIAPNADAHVAAQVALSIVRMAASRCASGPMVPGSNAASSACRMAAGWSWCATSPN